MGTGSFPGVKRRGHGVDHPPETNAEVKERVKLPLLPLWAFVACSRVNFTFTFNFYLRNLRFKWHFVPHFWRCSTHGIKKRSPPNDCVCERGWIYSRLSARQCLSFSSCFGEYSRTRIHCTLQNHSLITLIVNLTISVITLRELLCTKVATSVCTAWRPPWTKQVVT